MKAAILIPVLVGKDAVGADAMAMARILEAKGIQTRVFCESADNVSVQTWPADQLPDFAGGADDLVIYHFSISCPRALEILKRCKGFRVVKYHNVTPSEFFRDYCSELEAACEGGRAELPAIVDLGCELYLGASTYNIDELRAPSMERAKMSRPLPSVPSRPQWVGLPGSVFCTGSAHVAHDGGSCRLVRMSPLSAVLHVERLPSHVCGMYGRVLAPIALMVMNTSQLIASHLVIRPRLRTLMRLPGSSGRSGTSGALSSKV